MLGAQEVGKTTLTSHFMTSCNNGAYGNTDSFGKSTLHIDTLILPAIILTIVSLHYLSLRAAWASRADNFQNYGGKDQ